MAGKGSRSSLPGFSPGAPEGVAEEVEWTVPDVITRLHTGAWPGLASPYARYRTSTRTKAVRNDWIKAHQLIAKQTDSPETTSTRSLVRRSPTSEQNSQGGPSRPGIWKRTRHCGRAPMDPNMVGSARRCRGRQIPS